MSAVARSSNFFLFSLFEAVKVKFIFGLKQQKQKSEFRSNSNFEGICAKSKMRSNEGMNVLSQNGTSPGSGSKARAKYKA